MRRRWDKRIVLAFPLEGKAFFKILIHFLFTIIILTIKVFCIILIYGNKV